MNKDSSFLALINGRVVDATGREPFDGGTLVLRDGTIEAVGPAGSTDVPADARILDLEGRTVLPGLIDGHMHVTGMPGLLDAPARLRAHLQASEILAECLRWGTTTIGHAGGCEESLVLRDLIAQGNLPGRARLVVSGVVTATGGHVRGEGADGPWAIRRLVRRMALQGFDFIKTCATGGFQWAHEGLGTPDYSPQELQALVDETHLRGRLVHAHAHAPPGIQYAVDAGCDVILHGANIDARALDGIAARQLIFMPTLYITSEHTWGQANYPPHIGDRLKAAREAHREGVVQARKLGVCIAAGTDGGPRPGALMHELCELAACGFTPHETIIAATRNTARALGLESRLGTLEPGKVADCVVVDGDPLADLSVLTNRNAVRWVVKDGRVVVDRK